MYRICPYCAGRLAQQVIDLQQHCHTNERMSSQPECHESSVAGESQLPLNGEDYYGT